MRAVLRTLLATVVMTVGFGIVTIHGQIMGIVVPLESELPRAKAKPDTIPVVHLVGDAPAAAAPVKKAAKLAAAPAKKSAKRPVKREKEIRTARRP